MATNQNEIFRSTITSIFDNHNNVIDRGFTRKSATKTGLKKNDLELALAVLLVDLASCDQNFEMREYNIIQNGLRRIFGTTKDEVTKLINQANTTLKNLRGSSRFAAQLKENLDENARKAIFEVIEEVIAADGVEDGFETYMRHKFADLLGITLPADTKSS
ncbi:MAG: TerB family tellurite resistance protein [Oligoflexia bacterium]|nr:TerB family tellurite resistance protein [Oligoflexia bacterium]